MLTQPIFQGGALLGQYHLSQGRYEELLADYHKAVISAFANVEDALVAVQQTADQSNGRRVPQPRRPRLRFAQAQMRAGTINVLTLLVRRLPCSVPEMLSCRQIRASAVVVSLYQALGGGWQEGSRETRRPSHLGCARALAVLIVGWLWLRPKPARPKRPPRSRWMWRPSAADMPVYLGDWARYRRSTP